LPSTAPALGDRTGRGPTSNDKTALQQRLVQLV
jgi:hypothetical protein